jgi:hypothetical protein
LNFPRLGKAITRVAESSRRHGVTAHNSYCHAAQIHEAIGAAFGLSTDSYTLTQLRYDLRKMMGRGLLERDRRHYCYRLTDKGKQVAARFVLFHQRICGPLANSLFHHSPKQDRQAAGQDHLTEGGHTRGGLCVCGFAITQTPVGGLVNGPTGIPVLRTDVASDTEITRVTDDGLGTQRSFLFEILLGIPSSELWAMYGILRWTASSLSLFFRATRLSALMDIVVRTHGRPESATNSVRACIHDIDPELPVSPWERDREPFYVA